MSSVSFSGLASGIDSKAIIESLLAAKQAQVQRIQTDKQLITSKQSALTEVKNRVSSFRGSINALTRAAGSPFEARTAVSTDEDILTLAASSRAAVGSTTVRVLSLAANHQIGSQTFNAPGAEITQGTLDIRVGSGETTTITVDGGNNTLEGLANSITSANIGVTASVIGVGAGSYRLLLSSNKTGLANQITLTNNLAASAGDAVKPDFTGTAIQAAADAQLRIGSGAGAVTINNSSNRFDDVLPGVAIDLKSADVNKDVTITVAADVDAIVDGVKGFVDSYNELNSYIKQATIVNLETGQGSILTGERLLSRVQSAITSVLSGSVSGVDQDVNRLSAVGVTFLDDGTLAFDESKLRDVLTPSETNTVSISDVKSLFALSGASTNNGLQFVLGSDRTKAGEVKVDITQAAEQAVVTGGTALAASTVVTGANDTFSIKINGKQYTDLKIAQGTYTQAELALKVQESINDAFGLPGGLVGVSLSGGALRIKTNNYGSDAKIENLSGIAATALGYAGTETDTGVNVAGRFLVNGQVETAVGSGRLLTGERENANTADLQVRVTLGTSQVVAGEEGTLTITDGLGSRLSGDLGSFLDDEENFDAQFTNVEKALKSRIEDYDKRITRLNEITESQKARLELRFAQLESNLAQLQAQGQTLAAQLGTRTTTR